MQALFLRVKILDDLKSHDLGGVRQGVCLRPSFMKRGEA